VQVLRRQQPRPDRFSVNGNLELQNNFLERYRNNWSENLQVPVQVVQPPPDAIQNSVCRPERIPRNSVICRGGSQRYDQIRHQPVPRKSIEFLRNASLTRTLGSTTPTQSVVSPFPGHLCRISLRYFRWSDYQGQNVLFTILSVSAVGNPPPSRVPVPTPSCSR
jgi:hypothetical protein